MPHELDFYTKFFVTFIVINCCIYFLIQTRAKEKIFRRLFIYWVSILGVALFESFFTEGKLTLSLVFIVNFIPVALMAHFLFEMYDYKFNVKRYLPYIPMALLSSYIINYFHPPFFFICLPVMLVNIAPMIEFLNFVFKSKKKEFQMEKIIISIVAGLGVFSCVYYCIYRHNPTQLQYYIGFGSAFVSYLVCSILLPILCIKVINRKRALFLEEEINLRTQELKQAMKEKETLIQVLAHDISNPLQLMMLQLNQMKRYDMNGAHQETFSNKMFKSIHSIKEIITHVREYQSIVSGKRTKDISEVLLTVCLQEIEDIFAERFAAKNIKLNILNTLPAFATIKVDRVPFIHSVASNLVSNALKFSKPFSEVHILAYSKKGNIIIDVIDHGVGIPKQVIANLFDVANTVSHKGTAGELGTGFGMPIAKAYTNIFGGEIEVSSSQDTENSGTTVSLIFPSITQTSSEHSNYLH